MKWDLILMAAIYLFGGIMHFIKPKAYVKIIPKFLPKRRTLNLVAGAFEIILALGLLFPKTRSFASIGIILMLIVFLIVHFNMLRGGKYSLGFPKWILILRIPLQFFLIWWAYLYI
ncbi:DoxX family protein [Psychroflexus aestuariivivens]|uniref:DoxX family protein n=1 Tax=Psychroflexus aestuariivivens TaxID=1795040 RepID=UPI000FDBD2E2|nr:MauE/DoxX family redox-associated membrane protein [Psychroflexus aestuariivivens]